MSVVPPESRGAPRESSHERRIALFGGTFDPIHVGHLAVARAAERRFHLDEIHFIPTGHPPHKNRRGMACYADRYAMTSIACADHPRFVPSLAESGADHSGRETFYSIDTVRHFKQRREYAGAHFYFVVGADSFLDIPTWKDYETLLGLCDFVVASRPGFDIKALRLVIPPDLFARRGAEHAPLDPRAIVLRRTVVYILDTVTSHVSATDVRYRLDRNQSIHGLVPTRVEEYITKKALYR